MLSAYSLPGFRRSRLYSNVCDFPTLEESQEPFQIDANSHHVSLSTQGQWNSGKGVSEYRTSMIPVIKLTSILYEGASP